MAEWLKAHAWKACILAQPVSGVRIPVSPLTYKPLTIDVGGFLFEI